MSTETESNNGTHNSVTVDDKSRRHPRWTRQETLSLIQAKEITENSPHKGRKVSSLMVENNSEPKWVMISSYCKKQGVKRGPAQCRKRWSNLIGDFKKVKSWESKVKEGSSGDSFWSMRNDVRKENKLPVSFDVEVFKVLEGRESGAVGAVSPLPLQAVAAGCEVEVEVEVEVEEEEGAEGMEEDELVNNDGGGEKEFIVDVKDDVMSDVKDGVMSGVKDDVMSDVKDDVVSDVKGAEQKVLVLEWKEDVQKNADSVTETESGVQNNVCSSEPGSDEHHHQASEEQNNNSKQDTATEATKKPEPEISNRDSQENVKRRRVSTDDHKADCSEKQILQVLEANNKLLNAQLDNHNKNCQLDREQRKDINAALVTTLSKLTDVLVKIAEKL